MDAGALESLALGWLDRVADVGPRLIVNDRLDVAWAVGAAGVHVGVDDLPVAEVRSRVGEGFIVGASAHDRHEILAAQAAGADYAGLGAVFESPTKPAARRLDPWGADLIVPIAALKIPVLAIGGMTPDRVADAFRMPAVTGVAASGAIQGSEDPEDAIHRLREAMERAWSERERAGGRP